jgi:hypothetical protein
MHPAAFRSSLRELDEAVVVAEPERRGPVGKLLAGRLLAAAGAVPWMIDRL